MEWRKEKMAVSTTRKRTKKLDPRIERLLRLIIEARRAQRVTAASETGA
jgi:hypothetical protein